MFEVGKTYRFTLFISGQQDDPSTDNWKVLAIDGPVLSLHMDEVSDSLRGSIEARSMILNTHSPAFGSASPID